MGCGGSKAVSGVASPEPAPRPQTASTAPRFPPAGPESPAPLDSDAPVGGAARASSAAAKTSSPAKTDASPRKGPGGGDAGGAFDAAPPGDGPARLSIVIPLQGPIPTCASMTPSSMRVHTSAVDFRALPELPSAPVIAAIFNDVGFFANYIETVSKKLLKTQSGSELKSGIKSSFLHSIEGVAYLQDDKLMHGDDVIEIACAAGSASVVELLCLADPALVHHAKGDSGNTLLHFAVIGPRHVASVQESIRLHLHRDTELTQLVAQWIPGYHGAHGMGGSNHGSSANLYSSSASLHGSSANLAELHNAASGDSPPSARARGDATQGLNGLRANGDVHAAAAKLRALSADPRGSCAPPLAPRANEQHAAAVPSFHIGATDEPAAPSAAAMGAAPATLNGAHTDSLLVAAPALGLHRVASHGAVAAAAGGAAPGSPGLARAPSASGTVRKKSSGLTYLVNMIVLQQQRIHGLPATGTHGTPPGSPPTHPPLLATSASSEAFGLSFGGGSPRGEPGAAHASAHPQHHHRPSSLNIVSTAADLTAGDSDAHAAQPPDAVKGAGATPSPPVAASRPTSLTRAFSGTDASGELNLGALAAQNRVKRATMQAFNMLAATSASSASSDSAAVPPLHPTPAPPASKNALAGLFASRPSVVTPTVAKAGGDDASGVASEQLDLAHFASVGSKYDGVLGRPPHRSVLDTVKILLKNGASPSAQNNFGKTPYDVAMTLADQILPEGAHSHRSSSSELSADSSTQFDRLLDAPHVDWDEIAKVLKEALATQAPSPAAAPRSSAATA